jgi:hypothetical protein
MSGGGGGQQYGLPSIQMENKITEPWAPAAPALKQALSGATEAYGKTFQGPQVAGYDPNITAGENIMLGNAQQNTVGDLANMGLGGLGGILGSGGLSQGQQTGMGTLGGVAQNLQPYASGGLTQSNPYLDQVLQKSMEDASQGVNAQFSSMGRYGSGAHAGALGRELGGLQNQARLQDYYTQQQNQLAANQSLAGIGAQQAGIGQQGVGNLYGAGQALTSLYAPQNLGAQTMQDIGGQRQAYQQSLIDASNQAPWARVGNLANIATSIGGMGGTSFGQSMGWQPQQKQQSSTLGNILGGAMTGLGALKSFLPSDQRLKEDIEPVGKTYDGQQIYSYRYKGGGPKMLGLMAQEVMKKKPEAVERDPESGFLMVDYEKATS